MLLPLGVTFAEMVPVVTSPLTVRFLDVPTDVKYPDCVYCGISRSMYCEFEFTKETVAVTKHGAEAVVSVPSVSPDVVAVDVPEPLFSIIG